MQPILPPPKWIFDFLEKFVPDEDALARIFAGSEVSRERFYLLQTILGLRDCRVGCFAGAGVSIPYGVPAWSGFLELAADELGVRKKVQQALKEGRLEDVAQALDDYDHKAFEQIIGKVFDHKKFVPELRGIVGYLPFIGLDFIATTNFDLVIEKVFQICGLNFDPIIDGADSEFAASALNHGLLPLLKIHGTYYHKRTFTSSQYTLSYSATSPLFRQLVRFFSSFVVIFVGFSIRDRGILHALKTARSSSGVIHFAFLPSEEDGERESMLVELGVLPIWYSGDHENVDYLLAHLIASSEENRDLKSLAISIRNQNYHEALEPCERLFMKRRNCDIFRLCYSWSMMNSVTWGENLFNQEYVDSSISRLDRAIGQAPDFGEAYALRGLLSSMRFDVAEAVQDLDRAISLNAEGLASVIGFRGMLRFQLGDFPGSIRDFSRSLRFMSEEEFSKYRSDAEFHIGWIRLLCAKQDAVDRLVESCRVISLRERGDLAVQAFYFGLRLLKPFWRLRFVRLLIGYGLKGGNYIVRPWFRRLGRADAFRPLQRWLVSRWRRVR